MCNQTEKFALLQNALCYWCGPESLLRVSLAPKNFTRCGYHKIRPTSYSVQVFVYERTLFPIGHIATKAEVRAMCAGESGHKQARLRRHFIGPVGLRTFLLDTFKKKQEVTSLVGRQVAGTMMERFSLIGQKRPEHWRSCSWVATGQLKNVVCNL